MLSVLFREVLTEEKRRALEARADEEAAAYRGYLLGPSESKRLEDLRSLSAEATLAVERYDRAVRKLRPLLAVAFILSLAAIILAFRM